MARKLTVLLALVLLAGCGSTKKQQPTPVPPPRANQSDFVGIYSDDVYYGNAGYRRRALRQQYAAGVRLIRQPLGWADFSQDPQRFDDFVGAAAQAGIHVLPVLLGPEPGAPSGTAGMLPPSQPARFAAWAGQLVQRYGPDGTFWRSHPQIGKLPITSWQIWNEPNIRAFWSPRPDPAAYARLLRVTAAAIRKSDPHAEIVTAGLPTSHLGTPAPQFLAGVYRAGARGSFDTVAVHPYASDPRGVVARVRAIRRVVASNGDNARIWVTEIGWGTGGKQGALTVSRGSQAAYIEQTLTTLARDRRPLGIRGVVLFQWHDPKPFAGRRDIWPYFAGLLDDNGRPKPSLAAFRAAAAAALR